LADHRKSKRKCLQWLEQIQLYARSRNRSYYRHLAHRTQWPAEGRQNRGKWLYWRVFGLSGDLAIRPGSQPDSSVFDG
jgi:hypothetical protein